MMRAVEVYPQVEGLLVIVLAEQAHALFREVVHQVAFFRDLLRAGDEELLVRIGGIDRVRRCRRTNGNATLPPVIADALRADVMKAARRGPVFAPNVPLADVSEAVAELVQQFAIGYFLRRQLYENGVIHVAVVVDAVVVGVAPGHHGGARR